MKRFRVNPPSFDFPNLCRVFFLAAFEKDDFFRVEHMSLGSFFGKTSCVQNDNSIQREFLSKMIYEAM